VKRPVAPLEREIQRQCLEWLGLHGVFCWRQNAGALTVPEAWGRKRRFVRFASVPGVSDVLGVLPGGRFLAVEVKRPGNHPTGDQAVFLASVRAAGGVALVVYSVDDLADAVKEYL
jgi:hypothetical protein